MEGTVVGSYRVTGTLSAGGMGAVYRAEHTLIGRAAAVKVLHPELRANPDIVRRFFNEAKATTSIKHPGIVEIFDFGYLPSGSAYLIMEFLDGMPLSRRVQTRGPISSSEAALLLRGVCAALAAAHDKGIVHRDLKPDNIFMVPDPDAPLGERSKILDFGIAKLTSIGPAEKGTTGGTVMGTPTYMSPEQCSGAGDVDHRADLYSIGCIFYELVTGRPPFTHAGAGQMLGAHLYVDPEPPSRHVAGLSLDAEALIMTLLAKQPERRVQSAKELAERLAALAQPPGHPADGSIPRALPHPIAVPAITTPIAVPPVRPIQATTISGSTGQVVALPRRRRVHAGVVIAVGVLLVIAGIGLLAPFGGSTRSATSAQPGPTNHIESAGAAPIPAPQPTEPAPQPAAPAPPRAELAPRAEPTPVESSTTSTTAPEPVALPRHATPGHESAGIAGQQPSPPSGARAGGPTKATPKSTSTERPVKSPAKPTSTKKPEELIEQDI